MNKKQNKQRTKSSAKREFIKKNPKNYQDDFADEQELKGKKFPTSKVMYSQNDPQWYFKDANVLRDVASFSYEARLGSNSHYDQLEAGVVDGGINYLDAVASIPGVMAIEIAMTPGIADTAQSPVNLAATNVYSFVRYKNSGAANYDAPDLMMYLLSMDSLYAMWNWMKRLYGISSTYSQTNLYYPRALMEANFVDFDDMLANLANFRAYLNIKAGELSAFCVPATMSYNIRHSWMFSNVYTDSNTNKAQSYIFVPSYFYKYEENVNQKGGQLVPVPILLNMPTQKFKVSDLMSMFNSMIEAVQRSEDIGIMSGDILKAYGEGGLFTISTFEADYRVDPVYSQEVLSQIENAHILCSENRVSNSLPTSAFTITQDPDTNWILFHPTGLPAGVISEVDQQYLNFHWSDPTPENVIVATRLKAGIFPTANGSKIDTCGSEIAVGAWIYVYGFSSDKTAKHDGLHPKTGQPSVLNKYVIPRHVLINSSGTPSDMQVVDIVLTTLMLLSSFDWHPQVSVWNGETKVWTGPFFDFDKYALINAKNVEALDIVALLSEFNVPN